jgi:UDP-N-acetylmuramate: L-alanyl-gamma-D-glutamyl-meso-diaminopimelate ligase
LVNLVPRRGSIVVWGDSEAGEALHEITQKAFCPVIRYGFEKGNEWIATNVNSAGDGMTFSLAHKGKHFGDFTLAATGHHNVLNAMAALIVGHGRGIDIPAMQQALETFRSVRRRMDVKGEVDGVLVVDDFAHHPTAIRATIQAARLRWPKRGLWAVLEPRSNSMRRKTFQDTLPESLALADHVVLGSVHRAGQLNEEMRLDPETVATTVHALGKGAVVLPGADAIAEMLVAEAKAGDLILVMSNGSFDGLCEKLLTRLAAKRAPAEAHAR